MKFKTYLQRDQQDFFKVMTKLDRMRLGHPQEYGFHNDMDDASRGTFNIKGVKGKVKKLERGDSVWYVCDFDDDVRASDAQKLRSMLEITKESAGHLWHYVGPKEFDNCEDRCYTVTKETEFTDAVVIKVKGDSVKKPASAPEGSSR